MGERNREKHQCVVAFNVPPTGDLAHNPGMCPAWESKWPLFGSQAGAQSTEPHQPGLLIFKLYLFCLLLVTSAGGKYVYFNIKMNKQN